jgi:hypothetical protein
MVLLTAKNHSDGGLNLSVRKFPIPYLFPLLTVTREMDNKFFQERSPFCRRAYQWVERMFKNNLFCTDQNAFRAPLPRYSEVGAPQEISLNGRQK